MTHITREVEKEFTEYFRITDKAYDAGVRQSEWLHQQLQKARHDWLREEVVRLEGMKGGIDDIDIPPLYKTLSEKVTFKNGHNQALQTIIDRYQAELDQDKK